jgi:large subunit ribosomal protein L9
VTFGTRASETGKLYGSVTTQMIAEALMKKTGVEVNRRQVDCQPLRNLGTFKVGIRLTVDLIPRVTVVVHRETEAPELPEEMVKTEPATEA